MYAQWVHIKSSWWEVESDDDRGNKIEREKINKLHTHTHARETNEMVNKASVYISFLNIDNLLSFIRYGFMFSPSSSILLHRYFLLWWLICELRHILSYRSVIEFLRAARDAFCFRISFPLFFCLPIQFPPPGFVIRSLWCSRTKWIFTIHKQNNYAL